MALFSSGVLLAKEKKRSEAAASFALIAGTIYRPPGLALPNAEVTITPKADSSTGKLKKTTVFTDSRGEFALRVPAVPASYNLDVKRQGFQPRAQLVEVTGEQRYEVSIVLDPTASR